MATKTCCYEKTNHLRAYVLHIGRTRYVRRTANTGDRQESPARTTPGRNGKLKDKMAFEKNAEKSASKEKKSRKPRNPRFLYPQLILPRKLFTKKSRLLVSQSLFQSKKKRNRNLLRSKIKRILHLRKSYNHPNKPYLQLCSRLKLHILIQNQKKGIQYYGFYSSLDYLYF